MQPATPYGLHGPQINPFGVPVLDLLKLVILLQVTAQALYKGFKVKTKVD